MIMTVAIVWIYLARCHELSVCLVLGTPLLSSWWTATSIWSKGTFVTWIGVPPSQIGMLSISKVQLPNNRCRPLRLALTKVRSLLGLEASRILMYNGYIQRQTHWYLQISPPHGMNMIQTEFQVLQVRGKLDALIKLALTSCTFCQRLLIFQALEDHNLWKW